MRQFFQLALDLFDQVSPPPSPEPRADHDVPPRGNGQVLAPSQTLDQAIAPAMFRHPRATRQALLGHSLVAYEFRRGKRKTIGFVVGPEGLVVSAPRWVPLYEVDAALQEKAGWITRKLEEARQRRDRLASARIEWRNGSVIPFLGEPVTLVLDARHAFVGIGATLVDAAATGDAVSGEPRRALQIGLPMDADPAQIRDAVQAWLMRQANRLFTERLDHYAPALGVRWRKLRLSSAGTRWGSASADGSIRLNWRLVHFRLPVIDYVVVHELSHLRVMDHSPRFWETVASVVPDYAVLRSQLKDESLPQW